jgi:hypothetical protein
MTLITVLCVELYCIQKRLLVKERSWIGLISQKWTIDPAHSQLSGSTIQNHFPSKCLLWIIMLQNLVITTKHQCLNPVQDLHCAWSIALSQGSNNCTQNWAWKVSGSLSRSITCQLHNLCSKLVDRMTKNSHHAKRNWKRMV